jgi:hypothetical protein
MLLFLDICVFELRHISPAFHGQRSVQDNPCSKHTQPLEQTALPLQVHIRSCKKSDDLESRQEEVIRLFSQPNCKGLLGGTTSEQILSYAPRVIHGLVYESCITQ